MTSHSKLTRISVLNAVIKVTGYANETLCSRSRKREFVYARNIYMVIAHDIGGYSYQQVTGMVDRHRGDILNALRKHEHNLNDKNYYNLFHEVKFELGLEKKLIKYVEKPVFKERRVYPSCEVNTLNILRAAIDKAVRNLDIDRYLKLQRQYDIEEGRRSFYKNLQKREYNRMREITEFSYF